MNVVLPLILSLALATGLLSHSRGMNFSSAWNSESSQCLTRFREDKSHFSPCKTSVCFLFISQVPYIILDPRMKAENNQTLFPGKDRRRHFPDLSGIAFDMMDLITPLDESLLVYAGNKCSFNGMIDFISEHSDSKAGYRFGVTGIMFLLPHRILPNSMPTVPILEGRMVLLGPKTNPPSRKNVLEGILSPFERDAWLSVLGVVLIFALLGILISSGLERPFSFRGIAGIVAGDQPVRLPTVPDDATVQTNQAREDVLRANRISTRALLLSMVVFGTITILFYEISIVSYVFEQRVRTEAIDIQGLTASKLEKYIVVGEGAQEFVFRQSVDPYGKWNLSNFPWNRCTDLNDCFNKVLNKSHPAQLVVTYDFAVRYNLKRLNACDKLVVYETKRPLSTYNGGWYLNGNVPRDLRIRIDRSIVTLRLKDEMREILTRVVDDTTSLHCGEPDQKIGVDFLGSMFGFALSPFILVTILALLWEWTTRYRLAREHDD